jgi:hypothetical protein
MFERASPRHATASFISSAPFGKLQEPGVAFLTGLA